MSWNDEFECMSRETLKRFQIEKLRETVAWTYEKVPFYRRKLNEARITADKISIPEDTTKLPFTVKDD